MSHASGSPVFQNKSQFPKGSTRHIPFLPFRVRGDVYVYNWEFLQKDASIFLSGLQPAARIICPAWEDKFHTCGLRSIFFAAHVAEENGFHFFAPAGANSARL
ncbi:hypothetical protein B5G37_05585 [Pseudoflavonifractor sp. An85]|nr:hypothetical protein B5G37_05585 [Pseudoflavonifractor sp. An85]